MPKIAHLWNNLVKEYGAKRGAEIYYAMESEGKPPFKKGLAAKAKRALAAKKGAAT